MIIINLMTIYTNYDVHMNIMFSQDPYLPTCISRELQKMLSK